MACSLSPTGSPSPSMLNMAALSLMNSLEERAEEIGALLNAIFLRKARTEVIYDRIGDQERAVLMVTTIDQACRDLLSLATLITKIEMIYTIFSFTPVPSSQSIATKAAYEATIKTAYQERLNLFEEVMRCLKQRGLGFDSIALFPSLLPRFVNDPWAPLLSTWLFVKQSFDALVASVGTQPERLSHFSHPLGFFALFLAAQRGVLDLLLSSYARKIDGEALSQAQLEETSLYQAVCKLNAQVIVSSNPIDFSFLSQSVGIYSDTFYYTMITLGLLSASSDLSSASQLHEPLSVVTLAASGFADSVQITKTFEVGH